MADDLDITARIDAGNAADVLAQRIASVNAAQTLSAGQPGTGTAMPFSSDSAVDLAMQRAESDAMTLLINQGRRDLTTSRFAQDFSNLAAQNYAQSYAPSQSFPNQSISDMALLPPPVPASSPANAYAETFAESGLNWTSSTELMPINGLTPYSARSQFKQDPSGNYQNWEYGEGSQWRGAGPDPRVGQPPPPNWNQRRAQDSFTAPAWTPETDPVEAQYAEPDYIDSSLGSNRPADLGGRAREWAAGTRGGSKKEMAGYGGAFAFGYGGSALLGEAGRYIEETDAGQYVTPEKRAEIASGALPGMGALVGTVLGAAAGGAPGALLGQFLGQGPGHSARRGDRRSGKRPGSARNCRASQRFTWRSC